jgi:xylulokinase
VTRECILSLDVGTTGLKVGLFDADGSLACVANREQSVSLSDGGRAEQSAAETLRLLRDAVAEVLSQPSAFLVSAISVSNQRGTVIPLERDGKHLCDFILWMDRRGAHWIEWLRDHLDAGRYYDTCGHPLVTYTGISKLLWLQRECPDLWERCAVVAPPQTFILRSLGCSDLVCDQSTGSFLFPLDIREKRWSESLADLLEYPSAKLPKLVRSTEVVGALSPGAASDLGLTPGIPLVAGGGDGQCAAAGCGVTQTGRVMVNVGTAAGVQAYLSAPTLDPARTLNVAAHVDPRAWEVEGHTQASGVVLRWFRDEFGLSPASDLRSLEADAYDALIGEAMLAPAGSAGLLFLPTFNGTSAPFIDHDARGAVIGLTLAHKRAHIIRALLEGVAMELRSMLDAIMRLGVQAGEIRLCGGGSKNPHWNQIYADAFQLPVDTLKVPDAALVGAAMCAAVGLGAYCDLSAAASSFVQVDRRWEPRATSAEVYEETYRRYSLALSSLSRSGVYKTRPAAESLSSRGVGRA